MEYEITIAFSKNHEMTWSCDGKTKEQTEALAETMRAKYPDAQVTIGPNQWKKVLTQLKL